MHHPRLASPHRPQCRKDQMNTPHAPSQFRLLDRLMTSVLGLRVALAQPEVISQPSLSKGPEGREGYHCGTIHLLSHPTDVEQTTRFPLPSQLPWALVAMPILPPLQRHSRDRLHVSKPQSLLLLQVLPPQLFRRHVHLGWTDNMEIMFVRGRRAQKTMPAWRIWLMTMATMLHTRISNMTRKSGLTVAFLAL